jgi:hypothetical protein
MQVVSRSLWQGFMRRAKGLGGEIEQKLKGCEKRRDKGICDSKGQIWRNIQVRPEYFFPYVILQYQLSQY